MARKIVRFKDYLSDQLKDQDFRKHYEDYELPVRIALEIAELRRTRKMTQAQLAKRMGVSQQMVAQLENPDETIPNVRTLQKVAEAFGKHLYIGFR